MKLRILLAAFVAAPLAAMAQPADQPQANPNPTTNRYVPVADFFKLPPGRPWALPARSQAIPMAISGWWIAAAPIIVPAAILIR